MKVTVSGKTFYAALDPLATSWPYDKNYPEAVFKPMGKGWQVSYDVTPEQFDA